MKRLLLLSFASLPLLVAKAQDSSNVAHQLTISGYIKDLQMLTFDKDFGNLVSGNLIHNRINFKWKPTGKITGVAEFRNRLFWGEEVKLTPGFASLLKNENEAIKMQNVWIENRSVILLTNVERLYVDYGNDKLNMRVGRQRINWGLNTIWNPNDIFNSYNFLDFDYEERAGVDAGKIRYLLNNSFNTELAYAHNGKKNGSIAALKYALNQWGFDMQFITGWYHKHPTAGLGWAGAIKEVGFKGEVQYFLTEKDSTDVLNLSMEADYMFKNGWYVNLGFLFNNRGLDRPIDNLKNIDMGLSPDNLMPTKWNITVTSSKEITPLFSINASVLYSPATDLTIFYPSFRYNIATNLDVNLVGQSVFAEQRQGFQAVNHRVFLRLKWNF